MESEDEHLRRLLDIARGIPISKVHGILESTPKLAGIAETVLEIDRRGAVAVLLSHNPHYVCEWYARRFGFVAWDGMQDGSAPEVVDGIVQPPGPVRVGKVAGLSRLLERYQVAPREAVHVGDGRADAELFPRLGLGVALNSQLPEVNDAADVVLELADLRGFSPSSDRAVPKEPPTPL